jgi:hypothetical protein
MLSTLYKLVCLCQSNAGYWDEASRVLIAAIQLDTLLAQTG